MSALDSKIPGIQPVRAERLPDAPAEFLNHEAADARAGIEHRENKQRLEHDREVIPDAEQAVAADRAGKNLRHADGERRRAAGAIRASVISPTLCARSVIVCGVERKAPAADRRRRGFRRCADDRWRDC